MSALHKFKPASVQCRTTRGLQEYAGWRWREFHIRRQGRDWLLTHIPTGMRVPAAWRTKQGIAEAVAQIDALRDWKNITAADLTPELSKKVSSIVVDTGGVGSSCPDEMKEQANAVCQSDLNGYAGASA